MTRQSAIAAAEKYFDSGAFHADLSRRVAIPTESQNPERQAELERYLDTEMTESLARMGMTTRILPNPRGKGGPFLVAELKEDPKRPTALMYGHGDVIRGQENEWRAGLGPWTLKQEGDRIYGRGTADNKGQHTINLAALETVLRTRGKLGFNLKVLIETGEEMGSPGLKPPERHFGWSSCEVLAFLTGNPERPVNAIPARASATCPLRYVVGIEPNDILPALRRHLERNGFPMVTVEPARESMFYATRL